MSTRNKYKEKKMARLCPKCKVNNTAPNSYFCVQCANMFAAQGMDIRMAANKYLYECNDCGLLLEKDENYCPLCGSSNISARTLVMAPLPALPPGDPKTKYQCNGCGKKWEVSSKTKTTCCPRCGSNRICKQ